MLPHIGSADAILATPQTPISIWISHFSSQGDVFRRSSRVRTYAGTHRKRVQHHGAI